MQYIWALAIARYNVTKTVSTQSFLFGCLCDGVVNLVMILVLSLMMGYELKDAGL